MIYTLKLPARGRRAEVDCGLVVVGGVVSDAAPIASWAIGEPIEVAVRWAVYHGGSCVCRQSTIDFAANRLREAVGR